MCGIAGVLNLDGAPVSSALVERMTDCVAHRGPDGEGHFVEGPLGLGHRRLAIIDLSPAGHQPMTNEDGTVVVVYSGEIYNFVRLRMELETLGHRFHSRTDSEVTVHAWEEWGESSVSRFNGMFAFALWDARTRQLFLARDRYGIKPLYWAVAGRSLLFGSEIKSLLEHPSLQRSVSFPALNEYFSFQNVFSDLTLFEGVRLVPPGHTLTISAADSTEPRLRRYWDYPMGLDEPLRDSPDEALHRVQDLFISAVTRQLVSDVPVGTYLSGGMDSGSITAIAARHLPRLSTFTGGFDLSSASGMELGFDERPTAEIMANELKTEHYEVVMHAGDMEWVLPQLIWHLEDLRVGQSYPNYYVARLASKFVKVVLSGSGGDELFGGYPWRYFRGLASGRDEYLRRYYLYWQRLVTDEDKPRLFVGDARRALAGESSFDAFRAVFDGYQGGFGGPEESVNASLYFELKTFLPGLLVVEDKLSMAHGLETRVPFLDDDLVDYAVRLPAAMKVRNLESVARLDENHPQKRALMESPTSEGKAILRDAMAPLISNRVAERRKQGFSAPDASWFRGESIDYINRLLRDRKAMIYEFLDPAFVSETLDDHTAGRVNRRLLIWSLLSFEWWCRSFLSGAAKDVVTYGHGSGAHPRRGEVRAAR